MFPNLQNSLAPLVLRLGLAGIFLAHGCIKIFPGGGSDWNQHGLDPSVQMMVAWGELVGGLAIALGLCSRLAALGIAVIMFGAIATVTGQHEFVGTQHFGRDIPYGGGKVGYEYNFALIVMCFTLIVMGSGKWSVDYCLLRLWKGSTATPAPERGVPVAGMPS